MSFSGKNKSVPLTNSRNYFNVQLPLSQKKKKNYKSYMHNILIYILTHLLWLGHTLATDIFHVRVAYVPLKW